MSRPPEPSSTHLRDARLHKALEHAPDAQATPAPAVRQAILRHAHEAIAPQPTPAGATPRPWWQRLFGSPFAIGRPWNAGFATVLLACVVTGLWWGHETPGPRPEAEMPAAPQNPSPPAPSREAAERPTEHRAASSAPPAAAPARQTEPVRPAPAAARPAPQRPPSSTPQEAPAEASAAAEAQVQAQTHAERATQQRTDAARAARAIAPSAAAPSVMARARSGNAAADATRDAAPTMAPDADHWAALQVQTANATAHARSGLPAELVQAINELLRSDAIEPPDDEPVRLRIALLDDGGLVLGEMALHDHSLRWTPLVARTPGAFTARVAPALSLRVQQLLGR